MHNEPCEKLHLGCGLITPNGWVNLDGSLNARFAKSGFLVKKLLGKFKIIPPQLAEIPWNPDIVYHDVRKPLPFKDNSFSVIYAAHLIEHIYLAEAKDLLKECYRVLRPGGVLRVMAHDLKKEALNYIKSDGLEKPESVKVPVADHFLKRIAIRREPFKGSLFYKIYTILTDYHTYKWLYDADSLMFRFKEAGFKTVEERKPLNSRIDDVKLVELHVGLRIICIEGVK